MKASNIKWGAAIGVLFSLVLTAGIVGLKQEQTAPLANSNNATKQAQISSTRQDRSDSPTRWVKSDEALKHRAAAKLALENKLKQHHPVVSARSEKPVHVVKKPLRTIHPGAFYAHAPTPPGQEGFAQWVAKPVSESEITEKRQRLARGEQLFKSVIVRRSQDHPGERSGGMREIVSPNQ